MAEELGKIEKPPVEQFNKGRRLFFVPLTYSVKDAPAEFVEKLDRYWLQAEGQIAELQIKLGSAAAVYHELLQAGGEEGLKELESLNEKSFRIVKKLIEKGATLEQTEDENLLSEYIDWSRCLSVGLHNQKVAAKIYESYEQAAKARNEFISKQIDTTLGPDKIGVFFCRERHYIHFPADIEVFYVAPPALDEINRWLEKREEEGS
jgi:translation elongation factor EF-G